MATKRQRESVDSVPRGTGIMVRHRDLNEADAGDIQAIRKLLAERWGMTEDEVTFDSSNVRFIRGYMPDGPGWCGDMAWVVWGECCYQTMLSRGTKAESWRVDYEIFDHTPRAGAVRTSPVLTEARWESIVRLHSDFIRASRDAAGFVNISLRDGTGECLIAGEVTPRPWAEAAKALGFRVVAS